MTLPVSSYEQLLDQVREITNETILLRQQLSYDLQDNGDDATDVNHNVALRRHQNGKLYSDNTARIKARELEDRQVQTLDRRYQSAAPSVDDQIQSGKLTARLLAWQNRLANHQRCNETSHEEEVKDPSQLSKEIEDRGPRGKRSHRIRQSKDNDEMDADRKGDSGRESNTSTPERLYVRPDRRYENDGSSEEDGNEDPRNPRCSLDQGTWFVNKDQCTANRPGAFHPTPAAQHELAGGMSGNVQPPRRLGTKVDVVYSLLGILGGASSREDISATLLSMSSSPETCLVMRESGCLPLLVQLIHAPREDAESRERACQTLHNIVHARKDDKSLKRREARVLKLLQQLRDYCQSLRSSVETGQMLNQVDHPGAVITSLMRLSFDEEHRHAMCQLGGLHAIAELIEVDHAAHGNECDDPNCITFRRYAGMALTNLTFGDDNNKALLCSFREFMKALVSQLQSPSDDLRQVTASVLRNLSWRADSSSKQTLREVGAVIGLMKAAMEGRKESTLKSILSALWNLSAHCSQNKIDICAVEGALAFLVDMLSYKAPSKTLAIVENAGGILRNVSSHIAVREDYRAIVRERGCLQVLLRQLRSPSLTVVSNACGALWNLSARCPRDQRLLWELGAVPMLRSLVHSRHKMISMGSSAALKNLLSARPNANSLFHLDSTARGLGLPTLPTLEARRQRALEQEIDQSLSETCDNIEPSTSPVNKDDKFAFKIDQTLIDLTARTKNLQMPGPSNARYNSVVRSESRESMRSVTSTHSDTIFEKVNRSAVNGRLIPDMQLKQQSSSLHSAVGFDLGMSSQDPTKPENLTEKKYAMRYKNAIDYNLKSTISWTSGPEQDPGCSQILLLRSPIDKPQTKNLPGYENGDLFGNYAETDLDQPTDYSLRYSEQVLDEAEKPETSYAACSEIEQVDTIKTYCTEGTPTAKKVVEGSKSTETRDKIEKINLKIHADWQRVSGSQTRAVSPGSTANFVSNTFEDEPKIRSDAERKEWEKKLDSTFTGVADQNSDGDDDDEDLLACIHVGMQNNRHRQSLRRNSFDQDAQSKSNLARYQTSNALNVQVDGFTTGEESEIDNEKIQVSEDVRDEIVVSSSRTYSTTPNYVSLEDRQVNSELTELDVESVSENKILPAENHKSTSDSYDSFVTVDQSVRQVVNTKTTDSPVDPLFEAVEAAQEKPLNFQQEEEYRRQRDPDAMIASMDRLTAALVQQTEAMRERENSITLKQSLTSDIWNEETPTDVSFPSISMSAPFVGSFKSDVQDASMIPGSIVEEAYDVQMTTSSLIEFEATKLAEAVHAEMNKQSFIDLEDIRPPSTMGSLVSLSASVSADNCLPETKSKGTPVTVRKKSLPVGMVAKRAVANQLQYAGSLESLLNECNHSQIENYKPPSLMEFLPDAADMESSMISVASITSEIADVKEQECLTSSDPSDLIRNVPSMLAMACTKYSEMAGKDTNNSYSECLENINPPSLFNELSSMDELSAANKEVEDDQTNYTTCHETLCIDGITEFHTDTHVNLTVNDAIDELDDTDEGATPLHTEYCASSSADSTPTRRNRLTPRQKRQQLAERYKTYTIDAADLEKQLCEQQRKREQDKARRTKSESPNGKITPKQRRLEDRARFQTRVLGSEVLEVISPPITENAEPEPPVKSSPRSGIPTVTKSINYRTFTRPKPSEKTTPAPVPAKPSVSQVPSEEQAQKDSDEDLDDSSESEDSDERQAKVGPRITKPGMTRHLSTELAEETTEAKGIRGRRKPLYSTPRKPATTQSSPKQTAKPVSGIPVVRSNTSPIVRPTRATTLRQNNSLQKSNTSPRVNSQVDKRPASASFAQKKSPAMARTLSNVQGKRHSIPQGNEIKPPAKPLLERQGTFTKDEPEMENVPSVPSALCSPNKSRIAKPVRSIKAPSSPAKKTFARSTNASPKRTSEIRSPSPAQNQKQKLVKEAESKIAMLLKKAEETRAKQNQQKDTRKWLVANGGGPTNVSKIHRSSTLEGISQNAQVSQDIFVTQKLSEASKFRNSCDLSEMGTSEMPSRIPSRLVKYNGTQDSALIRNLNGSEDPEKRLSRLGSFFRVENEEEGDEGVARVASAIVAPFNYHPESVAYTTKDRNDGKRSGIVTASAKVTTV